MSDLWQVAKGLTGTWVVTVCDDLGAAITSFTGAEPLAGSLRAGRDSAPLITLAPTWADPAAGEVTVPIPGSGTATLDVGRYLVQITLADGSADLYEGWVDVAYSPGTAPAPASYGSFGDMLDRAPWIEKLQRPSDLAGFARQRHLAREWFEDLLHRHYRYSGGPAADFAFMPGVSFGYGYGVEWRDGRRSADLQGWLDDDRLHVTGPVIEACTCHAIAQLCERQVSPAKDDGGYAAAARKYYARAEAVACEITAEIDSDGDGVNDVLIRLGVADTLEG